MRKRTIRYNPRKRSWHALSLNGVKDIPKVIPYLHGFKHWCPGVQRYRVRGHSLIKHYEFLYVSYVLVFVNRDEAVTLEEMLEAERMTFRFLRDQSGKLCEIGDRDVERMRTAEHAARLRAEPAEVKRGDVVVLRSGVFSGQTGAVISCANNQALVLVDNLLDSLYLVAIHDLHKYAVLDVLPARSTERNA